jgi:sugar transferase EpsL
MTLYSLYGKRVLDVSCVLLAGVFWLPLMFVGSAFVFVSMGRPIFFTQPRPGLHGKIFKLYKLRTMSDGVETPLGRVLRLLSLDELPSFLNILKGDMSLVGPRPLLVQYLERYTSEQIRRHEVLPGLTGLAQVSGRNLLTWDQKFKLDLDYVQNQSLRLDIWILFQTVFKVLRAHGVNASETQSMPEFMGS